jgi:hypothetical protein
MVFQGYDAQRDIFYMKKKVLNLYAFLINKVICLLYLNKTSRKKTTIKNA